MTAGTGFADLFGYLLPSANWGVWVVVIVLGIVFVRWYLGLNHAKAKAEENLRTLEKIRTLSNIEPLDRYINGSAWFHQDDITDLREAVRRTVADDDAPNAELRSRLTEKDRKTLQGFLDDDNADGELARKVLADLFNTVITGPCFLSSTALDGLNVPKGLRKRLIANPSARDVVHFNRYLIDRLFSKSITGNRYNPVKSSPEEFFTEFCKSSDIRPDAEVAVLLRSVFMAGVKQANIDVGQLIDRCMAQVFRAGVLLRNVLSSFIVFGLLGTLFGLADSLHKAQVSSGTGNQALSNDSINLLFGAMKGVFAPSIWGVILTIAGVFLLSRHIRAYNLPLREQVQGAVLDVWIPALLPSLTQNIAENINRQFSNIERQAEILSDSLKVVSGVKDQLSEWRKNLVDASKTTAHLTKSVESISEVSRSLNKDFAAKLVQFSQDFAASLSPIASFEGELKNLYQQMLAGTKNLETQVGNALDPIGKQAEAAKSQWEEQKGIIDVLVEQIKSELVAQKTLALGINNFVKEATTTNTSVNAGNTKLMGEIKEKLVFQLDGITKSLSAMQNSLDQAATRLQNTGKTMGDEFNNIAGEIYKSVAEINKSVGTSNANSDKQNKLADETRKSIDRLASKIEALQPSAVTAGGDGGSFLIRYWQFIVIALLLLLNFLK